MSLTDVNWSTIPAPSDDGKASHLDGMKMPDVRLPATDDGTVNLGDLRGTAVLYLYTMTGRPDQDLPEGWDMIPGARGCTPQSCAYRDHANELSALGADHVYGISTQDSAYQAEAAQRLSLPFPLLSDAAGELTDGLDLPTQEVEGETLFKRLTMILRDGEIVRVFYPVFPPDQDAANVMDWLRNNPA